MAASKFQLQGIYCSEWVGKAWNAFSSIRGFVSLVISLNVTKAQKIKNRPLSPALNFRKNTPEQLKRKRKDERDLCVVER